MGILESLSPIFWTLLALTLLGIMGSIACGSILAFVCVARLTIPIILRGWDPGHPGRPSSSLKTPRPRPVPKAEAEGVAEEARNSGPPRRL